MNPYTFVLPRSFDPIQFLPLRLWPRADDARWLIGTILTKMANRDVDPWGWVRLDSQILRRVMYKHDYAAVIRSLEHEGAIETTGYYVGVKCKGYRLAKRYLGDRCVRVPATHPRLLASIDRERQRHDDDERRSSWLPIHYRLNAEQRGLMIADSSDSILAELPSHARLCQDVLVGNIRRREYPFSVGTTRRVFNGVTGLKRELRRELRFNGEPLGSVDIRCAQPGLLAMILSPPSVPKTRARYKDRALRCPAVLPSLPDLPSSAPDVACFCSLASSGRLYERLVSLSGLDRDVVKLAFLRDVLAKRGRYPSVVENAFRSEFPTVLKVIRSINRDDHGELIRLLQRLEAWLVVETIAPRLVGRVPVVTLHDAIYSTAGSLPIVEAAFYETFDAIGCRLALKVERP